jgi:hypothetical protein
MNKNDFLYRWACAEESEEHNILQDGLRHYGGELLAIVNGHRIDLPLILAAMKLDLAALERHLSDLERPLYDMLVQNSMTVDATNLQVSEDGNE